MIENANASKTSLGDSFKKYVGVATMHVVAVNPNNATLKKFGWTIPDDAEEPQYVVNNDGKVTARVRFIVELDEFEDKPKIPVDFFIRPEYKTNGDQTKCQIIDKYGRTAWATKEDIKAKRIPVYSNGLEANISTPYKLAHGGEEELVAFLMKLLNVRPFQVMKNGAWVKNDNPGSLTIDHWDKLVKGDVNEILSYISMFPDNRMKIILGVRYNETTNRYYQTFLNTKFLGNATGIDLAKGTYTTAANAIEKWMQGRQNAGLYTFSAEPVKEWSENTTATEVKESNASDVIDFNNGSFASSDDDSDDLPFD